MGQVITRNGPEMTSTIGSLPPVSLGYYASESNHTWVDTQKRPKPKELRLINGTTRYHQTVTYSRTYGYNAEQSRRAPARYWHPATPGSPPVILQAELDGKLRAKIKAQNLNLAQSIAEYRQTSRMFLDTARDVILFYRSLRSGMAFGEFIRLIRNPHRVSRSLADRWLAYQYGLRPTIEDIYALTEVTIRKIQEGFYQRVRASVTAVKIDSQESVSPFSTRGERVRYEWQHTLTLRGVAEYKVQSSFVKNAAQMGISNPLLLNWELIPFSFVVDWLFNVGYFFSSLDALSGTEQLLVQRSLISKSRSSSSVFGGVDVMEERIYQRFSPQTGLQLPHLRYEPSGSLKAVLNGLALLTQLRTGGSRIR